jgi:hypothetical protein
VEAAPFQQAYPPAQGAPAAPGDAAQPGVPLPEGAIGPSQPAPEPSPQQLASSSLPAGFGSTGAGYSGAPNMIGDFFGPPAAPVTIFLPNESRETVVLPTGGGALVGRLKIAENVSPIPRTRVFMNYSYFDNVPLTLDGQSVNRFSPGFERAFHDQLFSVEMRVPFASTLSSDIFVGDSAHNDDSHFEFGDLFLTLKGLLLSRPRSVVSAGVSLSLPTADDLHVFDSEGRRLLSIENESARVMPFLGWLAISENQRWFTQGFLQIDVDANGDPVLVNSFSGVESAGRLQESTFLYFDTALGYWLLPPSPYRGGLISGFAPTIEMHYNRSLQDADVIDSSTIQVQERQEDIQILNMIIGGTTLLSGGSTLTVGYGTPVGNPADQAFDGELRVMWNRFY